MPYETLEVERKGPIVKVWLDRPERLNAIDTRMLREVGDLFQGLQTDFDTRLVILGGRGRSFCAGADRKPPERAGEPASPTERERRWTAQLGRRACRAIEECEAVTLARVHGHALGGGACFALCCDFRIASRDALFRLPEVELGIPLSWGGTPRLIQEIGAARTREFLLLCRDVDAETAERWGLVHRVVEPGDLDAEVSRWSEEILAKPQLAVHMSKTQLRAYGRRSALGDVTEADGDQVSAALQRPEARERFGADPGRRR